MKVRPIDHNGGIIGYAFFCVGCQESHAFYIDKWLWDKNVDSPTVTGSIRILLPHPACHLNITSGMLQYQSDCDHALKGQTVPMEDV